MKTFKKGALAALLLGLGSVLFAQNIDLDDYTPNGYPHNQVTEIDNFMNVNAFKDVDFEKLFAFVSFWDGFKTGLATYVGDIYTSYYFTGNFAGFTLGSDKTTSETASSTISTTQSDDNNTFIFSSLIGLGNLGIKPTIGFRKAVGVGVTNETSKTKVTSENNDYTVKANSIAYDLHPEVQVGFAASLNDLALTPHFTFGMEFSPRKTIDETEGKIAGVDAVQKDNADTSITRVFIGAGTGIELPSKEGSIAKTSFGADLDFVLRFNKNKTEQYTSSNGTVSQDLSTNTTSHGRTDIDLDLSWETKFEPTEKLSITLGAGLPISMYFINNETKSTTENKVAGTSTTAYGNVATVKTSNLTFDNATLAARLNYKLNNALTFGVAAAFSGLPDLSIGTTKTITYDNTTEERKEVSQHTVTSTTFNDAAFGITWSSGFRLDLTKNVIFDCNYNVVGDLFTNFTENTLTGNDLFTGVGKILFHSLSFQLCLKF